MASRWDDLAEHLSEAFGQDAQDTVRLMSGEEWGVGFSVREARPPAPQHAHHAPPSRAGIGGRPFTGGRKPRPPGDSTLRARRFRALRGWRPREDAERCRECGGPVPPRERPQAHRREFCSPACTRRWHNARRPSRARTQRRAA
jgi:hypothetical protein